MIPDHTDVQHVTQTRNEGLVHANALNTVVSILALKGAEPK